MSKKQGSIYFNNIQKKIKIQTEPRLLLKTCTGGTLIMIHISIKKKLNKIPKVMKIISRQNFNFKKE